MTKWSAKSTRNTRRNSKNQALDFDDLIMVTIQLFERVPDVLEYYQRKFQYIHVDEYQDTNHAQYLLVKQLASRFKIYASLGTRINQSMVGAGQILVTSCPSKKITQMRKPFC